MKNNTQKFATDIRILALEMACHARASHIGSALSICDIIAVLYGKVLNLKPEDPSWEERDRFLLSKGHACSAVYAALAELNFFPKSWISEYGKDHSILMQHISHKVPGVEFSTGSLGHGLSFGVGKALAAKRRNKSWHTFVLLSDGELDEGSNWEALMFASHHQLNNLTAIIDYNKLQSLTTIENTLSLEPLSDKFSAFGWQVYEVDGHDHTELYEALTSSPLEETKPSIIIAHTTKGKGVEFMENKVEWHYRSPDKTQLEDAISNLRMHK
ncbi:transketolase [Vreelandella neptunia]|uniref:transketolase n=1 Tax=Vreelandella neptunia TaxID=115551 RepID=UPI00315AA908